MKGKHIKESNNKLIWEIVILILIIIFVYSLIQIINWIKSILELKQLEDNLFSKVITVETVDEEKKIEIDFDELKSINNEVIGWIKIENTNINYPITQADDNEYYLKHDINKKYSVCGNIFLDSKSKSDFLNQNSVIYGHNLKSGGMFADLRKIYNGDLGDKKKKKIYTPKNEFTYQVIAAYVAEASKEIIQSNFTENSKKQYISNVVRNSKIAFKNDAKSNENMITLITCYGDQRTVVNALKVD